MKTREICVFISMAYKQHVFFHLCISHNNYAFLLNYYYDLSNIAVSIFLVMLLHHRRERKLILFVISCFN
jgi:hypothetical protein